MNKVNTRDAMKGLTTAYKQLQKAAGSSGSIKINEIQDPALQSLAKSAAGGRSVPTGCGSSWVPSKTVKLSELEARLRDVAREVLSADKNGDNFVTTSERRELSSLSNKLLDWAATTGGTSIAPGIASETRLSQAVEKTLAPIADLRSSKLVNAETVKGNKVLEAALKKAAAKEANSYVSSSCGGSSSRPTVDSILEKGVPAEDLRGVIHRAADSVGGRGGNFKTLTDAKQALLEYFEPKPAPARPPRRRDPIVPSGC